MLVNNLSNYAEIIPGKLLFGDIIFSKDVRGMRKMNIGAVVDLCHYKDVKSRVKYSHEIDSLYLPVYDCPTNSIDWAEQGSVFIESEIEKGKIVYVHCYYGISRSSTLVLHYLMTRNQMKLNEALSLLRDKRPIVCPTFGFIKGLSELDAKLYKSASLLPIDYSIQCISEIFPNASIEIIQEKYQETEKLLEETSNLFIEEVLRNYKVFIDKIEPKGFICIELLKKIYTLNKRESCVEHHPFQ